MRGFAGGVVWGPVVFGLMSLTTIAVAADSKRPNILLIVADDLGYGELGCQGNPEIPTPHIDSLAKNGIRFTSGYVSGTYCSPTRAGLLTGKYQQRFGHEFNPGPNAAETFGISLKETLLPERLKAAGYATGMFGKWHLGDGQHHPVKRGFDEYFGFLGGQHSYFDPKGILRGTEPVEKLDYTTLDFAREASAFIEKNHERPWFTYLPFNAVHLPFHAPDSYKERFPKIEDPKRKTFAGMLSAMDDAIGTVLAKVREKKLEEQTLIIFFSDNGGPTAQLTSKNEPLSGHKAQVMEGGIRVPFLMQWKGRFPAGKVDDRPIIQIDLLPTALSAAGVAIDPAWQLDGVNLLPFLTESGNAAAPHETLFWRFGKQRAVRRGDWKLNDMGTGTKLFNLATDIGETTDLAAKNPEKLQSLEAAYEAWNTKNVAPKWGPRGTTPGDADTPPANPNRPAAKKKAAAAKN